MKMFEWNSAEFGEMNFENICRLYSANKSVRISQTPPFIRAFYAISGKKKYAIRWNYYQPRASFGGETFCPSDYFILKGSSEIKINEITYKLNTGRCYNIPKCKYKFEVISSERFEYIAAYELPDDFSIPNIS